MIPLTRLSQVIDDALVSEPSLEDAHGHNVSYVVRPILYGICEPVHVRICPFHMLSCITSLTSQQGESFSKSSLKHTLISAIEISRSRPVQPVSVASPASSLPSLTSSATIDYVDLPDRIKASTEKNAYLTLCSMTYFFSLWNHSTSDMMNPRLLPTSICPRPS
jgi:hypothetical protein